MQPDAPGMHDMISWALGNCIIEVEMNCAWRLIEYGRSVLLIWRLKSQKLEKQNTISTNITLEEEKTHRAASDVQGQRGQTGFALFYIKIFIFCPLVFDLKFAFICSALYEFVQICDPHRKRYGFSHC